MGEKNTFTVKYEVDDGYVGGSRPQSFRIREGDFDFSHNMTDEQIKDAFFEAVEEEMRQRISACNTNEDDFLEWARAQIAAAPAS